MLHLDISATLAKAITPTMGIPDQEFAGLRTTMKRHLEEWLRERARGEHGWSMNPYDKQMTQKVREVAMRVKSKDTKTVVWIGIGGSGLGPKVIQEAFETLETVEFIVIDTIDPAILQSALDSIDWRSTLLVVASKSGDTLETMSAFFLFYEHLRSQKKFSASARSISLTV
jgi:glucose-6-phosphate isomerase